MAVGRQSGIMGNLRNPQRVSPRIVTGDFSGPPRRAQGQGRTAQKGIENLDTTTPTRDLKEGQAEDEFGSTETSRHAERVISESAQHSGTPDQKWVDMRP
jgi:hypothetical protein